MHLLKDEVAHVIEEVLIEHPLPFELKDFQKLALHQIGSLNNVILVSPSGSGKMVVIYLAIFVLQKVLGVSDGVGIGCQPLSSIMNEKVGSKFIKSGTISMQGGLRTAEYEADESQLALSSAKEEFMNGELDIMIGHAESWLSDVAKSILDSLQQKGKIVFSFVDEAHIPLVKHWNSFRPELKRVPGMLRGRAIRGSPFLATTATLTVNEEAEMMKCFGLRVSNSTVLRASPVLSQQKFIKIERPPNMNGSYGRTVDGVQKPGHGILYG